MKSYSHIAAIIFFLALSLFPGATVSGQQMQIAYPNFYPFFEPTEDGGTKGFFYEILFEALDKRMGIETNWVEMPWQRCQAYVKSGKYDAMVTVPTEERSQYSLTHDDPFYTKQLKLFTYQTHPRIDEITTIQAIADILDGDFTVITYRGNGWHREHVSSLGVVTIETWPLINVWRMLAAKRGDLAIEWPMGAYAGMKEAGVKDKLVEIDVTLAAVPFHLLIGKKSAFNGILPLFNYTIQKMKTDGSLDRILSAYR